MLHLKSFISLIIQPSNIYVVRDSGSLDYLIVYILLLNATLATAYHI